MRHVPLLLLLALTACNKAAPVATDADTDPDTDTDTDTDSVAGPDHADGISVSLIEVNQAIGITVWDGTEVLLQERTSPIIAGRDAHVRVLWELEPGFEARDIEAVLVIRAGEESREITEVKRIEGPADRDRYEGTFVFDVPGDAITGESALSVSLHETDRAGVEAPNVVPVSGDIALEPWTDPMSLAVTILPCSMICGEPALDISENQRRIIQNHLMNLFPIAELDITWIEEELVLDACENGPALDKLQERRAADGAGPHEYYHCILPNSYDDRFAGGYGWINGADVGEDRVSFSVNWWGPEEEMVTNVAHELGHNHGRRHPWTDVDWQPPGATTGCRSSWGLGIRPGPTPAAYWHPSVSEPHTVVLPPVSDVTSCAWNDANDLPTSGDIMSYTHPTWVDPYTYNAFAERVRIVSGFSTAQLAQYESRRTLLGTFTAEGVRFTWGRGARRDGEPSSHHAKVRLASGSVVQVPVHERIGGDGVVRGFSLALPESAQVTTAAGSQWVGVAEGRFAGRAFEVDLEQLGL